MLSGIVAVSDLSSKGTKLNKRKRDERSTTCIDVTDGSIPLLLAIFGTQSNVDDLKNKHFKNRPYVVKGDVDRLRDLKCQLYDFDLLTMLENSASDKIHVWLKQMNGDGLESITVDDPATAVKLYNAGHSLYCRAPESLETILLSRLLKELNIGIAGSSSDRFRRGEIETFYSKAGHITQYHTDFQENITVMLSGKKVWSFKDSSNTHPLRGCTPHFSSSSGGGAELIETQAKVGMLGNSHFDPNECFKASKSSEVSSSDIAIQAGDVLYHPAGIWHQVECLEDSVSINISMVGASYAEVFCTNIQQLLLKNPAWRASIEGGAGKREIAHTVMQEILQQLPAILSPLLPQHILPPSCFDDGERNTESNRSSKDDDDDEDDNDDDSEDDEGKDGTIDVSKINVTEQMILGLPVDKLLANPCALLLNMNQLCDSYNVSAAATAPATSGKVDTVRMMTVHVGFGNENFESVSRTNIRIPLSEMSLEFATVDKIIASIPHGIDWKALHSSIKKIERNGFFQLLFVLLHSGLIVSIDKSYNVPSIFV